MEELNLKGDDRIICFCMAITQGEIKEAIKGGATTVEEIGDETGAGTVCGTCRRKIQMLIDENKENKDNN